MYKRTEIDKDVVARIRQFPHCDSRVLHAPGECEFCDRYPIWQALRAAWGIAFTGYIAEGKELPDPAAHNRSAQIVNQWPGNIARKAGTTVI